MSSDDNNFNCSHPFPDFSVHREGLATGISVGVGLGIGFIFAALFIFFKFIKRDVYGARVVHEIEFAEGGWLPAPPRVDRWNTLWYQKKAIINLISIIANAVQLSAFAFAPSIPWSDGSNNSFKLHLETIFSTFLLQWKNQVFQISFWSLFVIAAVLVYIILPSSGLIMVAFKSRVEGYVTPERDDPRLFKETTITYKIVAAVTLLLEMFGLTVLTLLLSPLNCTYHPDLPPTLDIDPSIICWQGRHVVYAACSIIVIIPLFTWSVIMQVCDHEKGMAQCFNCCFHAASVFAKSGPQDIETHYKWAYYYSLLKVAVAAGNTFFSHHSYVRMTILLIADILIFVLACRIHVNQFRMHNILRRLTIVGAIWTVGCGFIAQFICNPAQWDSFVIWLCGLGVLFIASFILLIRMYEEGLTYEDTHQRHENRYNKNLNDDVIATNTYTNGYGSVYQ